MLPEVARFYQVFGVTVIVVLVTAGLGRGGRRRPHVAAAVASAALLVWAVVLAERLPRVLVMHRESLLVHLVFANAGALALVAVVVTGIRLLRREEAARRRWHRRAIAAFLSLVIGAAVTGTYMIQRSTPRAASATSYAVPDSAPARFAPAP